MAPLLKDVEEVMRVVLTCLPAPPYPTACGSRPSPGAHGGGGGEDRISGLPDAVLSDIVSRLPAKEAARTAALSSRLRRVWASAPLVLDDSDILRALPGGGPARFDWFGTTDAVSRAIGAHRGPIRCVRLTCCSMALAARLGVLNYWLHRLADGGAEHLVLVNCPMPNGLLLTPDVLRIASLRTLYLAFWSFPDTAGLPCGPAVFPRLQEIGLCSVVIDARDIDHLLACSPVLEKLSIIACFFVPSDVRIRSRSLQCLVLWRSLTNELAVVVAPRLQCLILWQEDPCRPDSVFITRIRIGYATVLKVLGYLEPGIHQLQIGGTVIESGTKMIPSTMVPSVKVLALKVRFGIRKEAKTLPAFLRCFPNVETLHVLSGEADEPAGKLNLKFWQEVGPIDCLETHITKVVFDRFRGERYELAFLKFILEGAIAAEAGGCVGQWRSSLRGSDAHQAEISNHGKKC
ncbi:F-box/LRR-repeat protein [Panicum miliaceum]|uniref:F-box/LRR-repeat protein n=1 Tax=Panicum miliaceum TaxID=4540 RepID=A0A3L6SVT6_PANMI|nr:F-box/LRR-repeat protein [Panicum miliaceum]